MSLRAVRSEDKRFARKLGSLGMATSADIRPLAKVIFYHRDGMPEPLYPSVTEVADALNQLGSEQQAQVIIRRYGLDGKGERSFTQIAREAGVSVPSILQKHNKATRRLFLLLKGIERTKPYHEK